MEKATVSSLSNRSSNLIVLSITSQTQRVVLMKDSLEGLPYRVMLPRIGQKACEFLFEFLDSLPSTRNVLSKHLKGLRIGQDSNARDTRRGLENANSFQNRLLSI